MLMKITEDVGHDWKNLSVYNMEVSIVITNYNYGAYLERSIRSCLNQKMPDGKKYEVIVVDDCSTDI